MMMMEEEEEMEEAIPCARNNHVLQRLADAFNNEQHHDLVLQIDGRRIYTYRFYLRLMSPHFESSLMLPPTSSASSKSTSTSSTPSSSSSSSLSSSKSSTVIVEYDQYGYETIYSYVEYLHTGQLRPTLVESVLGELLHLAKQYDDTALLASLAQWLTQQPSTADTHVRLDELRSQCSDHSALRTSVSRRLQRTEGEKEEDWLYRKKFHWLQRNAVLRTLVNRLFRSEYVDIELLMNGKAWQLHRDYLLFMSSSPLLKEVIAEPEVMFVEIDDPGRLGFDLYIRFLYTGWARIKPETIGEVCEFAKRLQDAVFLEFCQSTLIEHLKSCLDDPARLLEDNCTKGLRSVVTSDARIHVLRWIEAKLDQSQQPNLTGIIQLSLEFQFQDVIDKLVLQQHERLRQFLCELMDVTQNRQELINSFVQYLSVVMCWPLKQTPGPIKSTLLEVFREVLNICKVAQTRCKLPWSDRSLISLETLRQTLHWLDYYSATEGIRFFATIYNIASQLGDQQVITVTFHRFHNALIQMLENLKNPSNRESLTIEKFGEFFNMSISMKPLWKGRMNMEDNLIQLLRAYLDNVTRLEPRVANNRLNPFWLKYIYTKAKENAFPVVCEELRKQMSNFLPSLPLVAFSWYHTLMMQVSDEVRVDLVDTLEECILKHIRPKEQSEDAAREDDGADGKEDSISLCDLINVLRWAAHRDRLVQNSILKDQLERSIMLEYQRCVNEKQYGKSYREDLISLANQFKMTKLKRQLDETAVDFKWRDNHVLLRLSTAFNDSTFHDTVIHVGKEKIYAHRFYLQLMAPNFWSKLTPTEAPGVFECREFRYETTCQYLEYLYTGEVEVSEENLDELYRLAYRYEDATLLDLCESYMASQDCPDSVERYEMLHEKFATVDRSHWVTESMSEREVEEHGGGGHGPDEHSDPTRLQMIYYRGLLRNSVVLRKLAFRLFRRLHTDVELVWSATNDAISVHREYFLFMSQSAPVKRTMQSNPYVHRLPFNFANQYEFESFRRYVRFLYLGWVRLDRQLLVPCCRMAEGICDAAFVKYCQDYVQSVIWSVDLRPHLVAAANEHTKQVVQLAAESKASTCSLNSLPPLLQFAFAFNFENLQNFIERRIFTELENYEELLHKEKLVQVADLEVYFFLLMEWPHHHGTHNLEKLVIDLLHKYIRLAAKPCVQCEVTHTVPLSKWREHYFTTGAALRQNITKWLLLHINIEPELRVEECDETLFQLALIFRAREPLMAFCPYIYAELVLLNKMNWRQYPCSDRIASSVHKVIVMLMRLLGDRTFRDPDYMKMFDEELATLLDQALPHMEGSCGKCGNRMPLYTRYMFHLYDSATMRSHTDPSRMRILVQFVEERLPELLDAQRDFTIQYYKDLATGARVKFHGGEKMRTRCFEWLERSLVEHMQEPGEQSLTLDVLYSMGEAARMSGRVNSTETEFKSALEQAMMAQFLRCNETIPPEETQKLFNLATSNHMTALEVIIRKTLKDRIAKLNSKKEKSLRLKPSSDMPRPAKQHKPSPLKALITIDEHDGEDDDDGGDGDEYDDHMDEDIMNTTTTTTTIYRC